MTPNPSDILTRRNLEAMFAEHESQKNRDDAEFAIRVDFWHHVKADYLHFDGPSSINPRKTRAGSNSVGATVPGKFKQRKHKQ